MLDRYPNIIYNTASHTRFKTTFQLWHTVCSCLVCLCLPKKTHLIFIVLSLWNNFTSQSINISCVILIENGISPFQTPLTLPKNLYMKGNTWRQEHLAPCTLIEMPISVQQNVHFFSQYLASDKWGGFTREKDCPPLMSLVPGSRKTPVDGTFYKWLIW